MDEIKTEIEKYNKVEKKLTEIFSKKHYNLNFITIFITPKSRQTNDHDNLIDDNLPKNVVLISKENWTPFFLDYFQYLDFFEDCEGQIKINEFSYDQLMKFSGPATAKLIIETRNVTPFTKEIVQEIVKTKVKNPLKKSFKTLNKNEVEIIY
jgi:hypothetical protein